MEGTRLRITLLVLMILTVSFGWAQHKQLTPQEAIRAALTSNGTGPEVGANDFRISDMGPDANGAFDAFEAAVVYNSIENEYLVVWSGDDDKNEEFEIWGQRIDAATGEEIGVNDFQISDVGPDGQINYDAYQPAVAYNNIQNEYLVVWYGDDNQGTLVNDEFEIFGQLLDASGAEIGNDDFRISYMGSDGFITAEAAAPAVAFNSVANTYLVVWHGDDAADGTVDDEMEIYAAGISPDGFLQNMSDIRLSDMGPDGDIGYAAMNPAVVFNSVDNEFLIIWEGDDNNGSLTESEFEIFAQRFNSDLLSETGINDFRVSEQGSDGDQSIDANNPAVVYNHTANEYLVVWQGDNNTPPLVNQELEIYGQILSGGTNLAKVAPGFRISDMGPDGETGYAAINPSVAFNSETQEYLVVWEGDDNIAPLVDEELEIFGQYLSSTGEEIGENDFRISDMGPDGDSGFLAFKPAAVYNSSDNLFLAVWEGKDLSDIITEIEIYGQQLSSSPKAPANLTSAEALLQINLSWTQTTGRIEKFYIFRDESANATALIDSVEGSSLSYSDNTVNEMTRYYYRVTALDSNGFVSALSNEVNGMPLDNTAPDAPFGVEAIAGNFLVDLLWEPNTEADLKHYTIFRNTSNDFNGASKITRLSSEFISYRDSSLTGSETYYYWLKATDISGNISEFSSAVSATPVDNIAPSAPQEVEASADFEAVTLTWQKNTEFDLANYGMYRSEENQPNTATQIALIAKTDTLYTDTRVENDVTYYYWMKAFDASNNGSAFSLGVSAMPQDLAPAAPVFTDVFGTDERVELNWQRNTEFDIVSYTLYRALENDFDSAEQVALIAHPENEYVDFEIENMITYFYWLAAVDDAGNKSDLSDVAIATPMDNVAPSTPQNVVADGGAGFIQVDWQESPENDVAEYVVYRSSTSPINPTDTLAVLEHPNVSYSDNSVEPEVQYTYWITAVDENGNESPLSASVTAIASSPVGIDPITGMPVSFELYQNFPNPFNPSTTIVFDIPEPATVNLAVYNMLGQVVRTLVAGKLEAGRQNVQWDGKNEFGERLSSGVYLYRIEAGNFVQTRKLVLMK